MLIEISPCNSQPPLLFTKSRSSKICYTLITLQAYYAQGLSRQLRSTNSSLSLILSIELVYSLLNRLSTTSLWTVRLRKRLLRGCDEYERLWNINILSLRLLTMRSAWKWRNNHLRPIRWKICSIEDRETPSFCRGLLKYLEQTWLPSRSPYFQDSSIMPIDVESGSIGQTRSIAKVAPSKIQSRRGYAQHVWSDTFLKYQQI